MFCWLLCCLYYFWSLYLIFFISFLFSLCIFISMHSRYFQCWGLSPWDSCHKFGFEKFSHFPEALFKKYSFLSSCSMVSAFNISKYLHVLLSPSVLIFSWFGISILSIICLFSFSLSAKHIFLYQIPSLYPDSIILIVFIMVCNSFFIFCNILLSSMYMKWLIFSCDLVGFYLPVHFLSMWISGIIAITNNNDDRKSSRNIPPWIFSFAKLFPPVVTSTFQFFVVSGRKFIILSDILYILTQSIILLCRTISYTLLLSICAVATFFRFGFSLLENVLINV